MSSKKPAIRLTSWRMVIPQLVVMLLLIVLVAAVFKPQPPVLAVTIGAGIFLLYSYSIRWLLLKPHKQGLKLTFAGEYQAAIASHETSLRFFERYPWIDRFRALTLMTPSAFSFAEMALLNMAYCYGQLGDIEAAKAFYQQTLNQYPDNEVAAAALNLINAAQNPPTA